MGLIYLCIIFFMCISVQLIYHAYLVANLLSVLLRYLDKCNLVIRM